MVTVRHIALFVPDLQGAEAFYQHIFGLKLLMREAPLEDLQWYTLPTGKGWLDAKAAGIEIGMVALKRDAFILALFQGQPSPEVTVLEIGITMDAKASASVRDRLPGTVEIDKHERDLLFRDPYGYRWHISPTGVTFQSNGDWAGRWLEV